MIKGVNCTYMKDKTLHTRKVAYTDAHEDSYKGPDAHKQRTKGLAHYRNITQDITLLAPAEAATFMALAWKSDYRTYHSAVTEQTLAQMLHIDVSTVRRHLSHMIDRGLVRRQSQFLPGPTRRNHYWLATAHYVRIDVERLLALPIPMRHKGMAAQIKALCLDGTNLCLYSAREIAERLGISRRSAETYLHDLQEMGLLRRRDLGGYELTHEDIFARGVGKHRQKARDWDREEYRL